MPLAMTFVAIDFETANPTRQSACAVGLVRVENKKIVHQESFFIKPPSNYFAFTSIHGITWADVRKERTFGELYTDLSRIWDGAKFFVAHNASFDASVLRACSQTYGCPVPEIPFQCTVKIARATWNLYPTKLPDVCRYLGVELERHHEALSDARACAEIMLRAHYGTSAQREAHS